MTNQRVCYKLQGFFFSTSVLNNVRDHVDHGYSIARVLTVSNCEENIGGLRQRTGQRKTK